MIRLKKLVAKIALTSLLVFSGQTFFLIHPHQLDSANLTSAADTLSTSRLSYYDALSSLHLQGTTLASVTSTANLFTGDSVLIGDNGTAGNPSGTPYTVDDVYNTTQFTTTGGLDATDIQSGDVVIATRSATHTVTFTTASAISNGAIRILIPSGANGNNNGIPNHDGFDFGVTAPSLTGPSGGGVTSWETATATASGGTWCTAGNHCFEARYNGTNNVNAALTFTIGGANKLINPSPGGGHTAGTADTYTVTIQHLGPMTSQYPVMDPTTVKIAVIESVRVTATVDPTITFTVAGVGVGITACLQTLDITSTATTIPYGTLTLASFNDAAQQLSVVTNAAGGYAVTIISDDQLSIGGDHAVEIENTDCDNENCTDTVSGRWSSENDISGFGFSLHNIDANTAPFWYSTTTGNCSGGSFCARMIPSTATASETPDDSDTALQIMSRSTVPSTTEDMYVCYRLVADTTQTAGDYENNVTYTATATF